ncbi:hypothetical protein D3C78_1810270 [compost metagenome]
MQFVDRQRRTGAVQFTALLQPLLVLPFEVQRLGDFRRGIGGQRRGQGHRIGLEWQDRLLAEDFILVGFARL